MKDCRQRIRMMLFSRDSLAEILLLSSVLCICVHHTTGKGILNVLNDVGLHPHDQQNYSLENTKTEDHHRSKRVANNVKNDGGLLVEAEKNAFNHGLTIALGMVTVFCLSTVALTMCIFCNACEDDKAAEPGGARGYVGEINLADIQVIYNASAGAAPLPYAHQNQAFKSSQEDIVMSNPAVLEVNSSNGGAVHSSAGALSNQNRNQMPRLVPSKGSKEFHQMNFYLEKDPKVNLGFENPYAESLDNHRDNNQHVTAKNSKQSATSSVEFNKHPFPSKNISQEHYRANITQKEYDMNDTAIKNMHVRY